MTDERRLRAAMVAAVSVIGFFMFLDERREFEDAVERLTEEQTVLAMAVGADFEARLARHEEAVHSEIPPIDVAIPELLGGAMRLEQRGSRMLLVTRPGREGLLTTDGSLITSRVLQHAIDRGASSLVLPRAAAAKFGLPERIGIAGITRIQGRSGDWGVVVLVSGERLRARERHAQLRFLLSLGLVTALVMTFGGLALRQQRRKLEVARALEVSALERDRDRLLARADKMATVAALSSGIAHEIATPLGTIMARVEQVLPAVEHDGKASAALHVALSQVQRIQHVIRGVLALARGDMPALVRARPEDVVKSAVELVRHRFDKAGVGLSVEVSSPLPELACDPPMLEQALANLLLNACDASTRTGKVYVRVRSVSQSVRFVVEDEGEGISSETAARAREPFFTTKPKERGTGLGLAIAQEIVSHHSGKLTLEKRTDTRGTRASIELPQASFESAQGSGHSAQT